MTWNSSDEWANVMGEQGPWIRHVAAAWQAAATDAPDVPIPARPSLDTDHEDVIAYWAPLLHLLVYGLGWTRPDLGLEAWRQKAWPTEDPILRVVHRWWGEEGVLDVLAWTASNGGIAFDLVSVNGASQIAHHLINRRVTDSPDLERRRATAAWQQVWGGGWDSMHLTIHVDSPLRAPDDHQPTFFNAPVVGPDHLTTPRWHISTPTYAGWYANFFHYMPGTGTNGRSVRTDIVVKPIGWLGEFRQHKKTKLWFRGRSSVHLWGQ
ncbi:hypothetical protein [Aeromicrobium yanjiei]|uniref:Uncharacterized protein n=1 Tax=Aeromicrobium yanjiei TaxID=2662028 RepID=A0A5Q2MJD4_9ACTN|nr:hypothetical protein [Aeromicrobium yanjiei]QGG41841.1 hypothetical protein GEV26_10955 [Aeromicrobium yanjiei]